jgi:hypothetical protein
VTNNIIVNNSLHPHCWYAASGDVFRHNIVFTAYQPAGGMPADRWGREIDFNLFARGAADRERFAAQGCDARSLVGDPQFVDPARGDFRVGDTSPALRIGFCNFRMDDFGVRSPHLRALARTPAWPDARVELERDPTPAPSGPTYAWRGARLRDLAGADYSVHGVSREAGGIVVEAVPGRAQAERDGLLRHDLIQSVNDQPVGTVADLSRALRGAPSGAPVRLGLRRDQAPVVLTLPAPVEPPRL